MFAEKTFSGSEVPLNYAEGPANGPPLVMLHGLTSSWKVFLPLLDAFLEERAVVLPDLRGHGLSGRAQPGRPANTYRAADYARDIIPFLTERFTQPVSLIGHSLGALVALHAAARAQRQVRALVLLDPPLFLRNAPLRASPGASGWFGFVRETLQTGGDLPHILEQFRTRYSPSTHQSAYRARAEMISQLDPRVVDWDDLNGHFLPERELIEVLQAVRCPTLLLRGEWQFGAQIREEDAAFLKTHLPHAWDIQLARGSHAFPWDQMDATLEHVRTFLRAYDPSQSVPPSLRAMRKAGD